MLAIIRTNQTVRDPSGVRIPHGVMLNAWIRDDGTAYATDLEVNRSGGYGKRDFIGIVFTADEFEIVNPKEQRK